MTPDDNTPPDDRSRPADVLDQGTTRELVQDKLAAEDILRETAQAERSNPNDQPGFQDGIRGGWDGEDRQGTPNNDGDSDLEGQARGGEGAERSGGVDGGPARSIPLPGTDQSGTDQ